MNKNVAFLALLAFLWGCAVAGRDFPTAPVKNIRPNETTQSQIFATFGEPVEKGLDTGYETWTYYQYSIGQTVVRKRLQVMFNKDGTVRSYSFSSN